MSKDQNQENQLGSEQPESDLSKEMKDDQQYTKFLEETYNISKLPPLPKLDDDDDDDNNNDDEPTTAEKQKLAELLKTRGMDYLQQQFIVEIASPHDANNNLIAFQIQQTCLDNFVMFNGRDCFKNGLNDVFQNFPLLNHDKHKPVHITIAKILGVALRYKISVMQGTMDESYKRYLEDLLEEAVEKAAEQFEPLIRFFEKLTPAKPDINAAASASSEPDPHAETGLEAIFSAALSSSASNSSSSSPSSSSTSSMSAGVVSEIPQSASSSGSFRRHDKKQNRRNQTGPNGSSLFNNGAYGAWASTEGGQLKRSRTEAKDHGAEITSDQNPDNDNSQPFGF